MPPHSCTSRSSSAAPAGTASSGPASGWRAYQRDSARPALVTAAVALLLGLWALYGLSGAGAIWRLPLLRPALALAAVAYLGRGLLGIPAVLLVEGPYADELKGRMVFMAVSSLVCVFLGLCYAFGAARLRRRSGARPPEAGMRPTPRPNVDTRPLR